MLLCGKAEQNPQQVTHPVSSSQKLESLKHNSVICSYINVHNVVLLLQYSQIKQMQKKPHLTPYL